MKILVTGGLGFIGSNFILKPEVKFLIEKCVKKNKKQYKNLLLNNLFKIYIKKKLFTQDYIGIIIYQILEKLKL